MARIRKRFEKIVNNPVDVKWDLFCTIIEHYNLIIENPNGGSHFMVYHPSDMENTMIPIPVHQNRVKKLYVKRVIRLIEQFEEDEY